MDINVITATLLLASIVSLVCRVAKMHSGRTKFGVFLQHAGLALALFGALFLPSEHAKAAMAAGVLLFLLLGSRRWADGAPPGTDKTSFLDQPIDLNPLHWSGVNGGKR